MGKLNATQGHRISVVIEDLEEHPHCRHGPTLLFKKEYASCSQIELFYGCSACRNREECNFYMKKNDSKISKNCNSTLHPNDEERQVIHSPDDKASYCHTCSILTSSSDGVKNHKNHDIQLDLTDYQLKSPTLILKPLSNDKKEAQYFFSEDALQCFANIFKSLNLNKVICIGAPRLNEYLKSKKDELKIKSILLDLDHRLKDFYDSEEYLLYNMFNHHFFGGKKAKNVFRQFLKLESNENICLVTDPPFGCRTEPLAFTIKLIERELQQVNASPIILPTIWVFPYFMEVYIRNEMPQMEMSDYKVDYTNHISYTNKNGRKQGSPVRFFTNIPLNAIALPPNDGYKWCQSCDKWTAIENVHCKICKICPSKNGSSYVHCKFCNCCVKSNYKHCGTCGRCTQIEGHRCFEYQKHITCKICKMKGHGEIRCNNRKYYVQNKKSKK